MRCPLCGAGKARRNCPALGQQICSVCCGTKRQVEVRCPADCPYLASAHQHPPAVTRRQHEQDLSVLVQLMRGLTERQSRLLLGMTTFLAGLRPDDLQAPIDQDVADAASALAATLETSAKGVIYDHRPASRPAERLAASLRGFLAEVGGQGGGAAFERDAAVVLRRLGEAAGKLAGSDREDRRPFLDLAGRLAAGREPSGAPREPSSRLIVP